MKFKDCFIDGEGNIWRAKTLIKASKELPVFQLGISRKNLDTILRWKLVNLRDYLNHYQRVMDANLSNPLILRSDGYIMNGWHRVIKALYENKRFLPAKIFKETPPPDFSAEELETEKEELG